MAFIFAAAEVGKTDIDVLSKHWRRWRRSFFSSQHWSDGSSPLHKDAAHAIAYTPQSLPLDCCCNCMILTVTSVLLQWRSEHITLSVAGERVVSRLSYTFNSPKVHPIVDTQIQWVSSTCNIWTPSPLRIGNEKFSPKMGLSNPLQCRNPLFSSWLAAEMCLSVNQSPKRIAFLSSKFKLSSDTQIGVIHSASFLHGFPPWQRLLHFFPFMTQPQCLDEQPFLHEQYSRFVL